MKKRPVVKKGKTKPKKSGKLAKAKPKAKKPVKKAAKPKSKPKKMTRAKKPTKTLGKNPLDRPNPQPQVEEQEPKVASTPCPSCGAAVSKDDHIECPTCGHIGCSECIPEGEPCPKCDSKEEEPDPKELEETLEPAAETTPVPEAVFDDGAIPDPAFDKVRAPAAPEDEGETEEPDEDGSLFAQENDGESDEDEMDDGDDADDDSTQQEE